MNGDSEIVIKVEFNWGVIAGADQKKDPREILMDLIEKIPGVTDVNQFWCE